MVADNITEKAALPPVERMEMLREILKDHPNIEVVSYQGLVVDFAVTTTLGDDQRRALVDLAMVSWL